MGKRKAKLHSSKSGYNLVAKEYDKKESYLNSFEQGNFSSLLTTVRGQKILDVGAGTGRLSLLLARAGASVTALDVSEEMLKVLNRKNKNIASVIGDAENLPFPDMVFDMVMATFVIVHLKDPGRFFDEARRILKEGGKLIVTNINQKDPPIIETKEGNIVIDSYYHRPEKIRQMLEDRALAIEDETFIKEKGLWINQIIIVKK
ncbi:MAG: hypothetical protein A3I29_01945 [Candidatus Magasanikbacteria bacterium RIFCSPLOWO2_02_FULL_44_11]|uniref:Methyltransferase type 11 domain-containing protein n=1 Tax=Candidatus Magasanikbacteria bacterium RIFCSPLOWO2_02_FULL_44_11 TaxID=1798689 RepID=A0A1F6N900_9BACT|nr:MAG: hypothetical protein A3I29_01945 [Candidatus Magasanikbacteria bacterium RIFCSPLOWO2_02_FULL_44_11]